jgi:hypothetical protein
MAITISNRSVKNYNAPDPVTGLPRNDQYLDFTDENGTVIATLNVPASSDPTFAVDGSNIQTVYSATVTLTDADIKALPTTPFVIIPPTEILDYSGLPTQLVWPFVSFSLVTSHAADYTNVNVGCFFGVDWGSDDSYTLCTRATTNNIINELGEFGTYLPLQLTGSNFGASLPAYTNTLKDSLLDNALVFFAQNQGDGNFTGGDPANEMKLIVRYTVIDLS